MNHEELNACEEYRSLSRRNFLVGAAKVAAIASIPAWLPRVAFAEPLPGRDRIISVYLRGGIDGLTLCVPHGDPGYYANRPNIAIPAPTSSSSDRAIDLDGFFGLPKALAALEDPYREGWLAIAHAVGAPVWSRSHFDAQRWMETCAINDTSVVDGWLARHLATSTPIKAKAILRAISMTYGMRQTLAGAPLTLPIPDPDNFDYAGWWYYQDEMAGLIQQSYKSGAGDPLVRDAAVSTDKTMGMLDQIDFANYTPTGGAVYPEGSFGQSLRATAALLKANVGVEAIHIDIDGWDTHANQGPIDGYMFGLLKQVGDGLGALWKDLSSANVDDWVLVALSEFGRTAIENNSLGCDHGTANAMLVMGGGVRGNQVYRSWPGLAVENLYQGVDLKATMDYRDILSEMVDKRLKNPNLGSIFPGYTPNYQGLFN